MLQTMNLNGENNNNDNALGCGICGKSHNYLECELVKIKRQIPDSPILSRARSTLPSCVGLMLMSDGSYSIAATTTIENGIQFGPLEAQKLHTLDPSIQLPLKMFNSELANLSEYYFDTCDENNGNWMIFVNPAQNYEEQNLMCFQDGSNIFYVTTKEIKAGEYLKLWYSPHYAKLMGREVLGPVIPKSLSAINMPAIDIDELLKSQQNIVERDNWSCKFCGKLENTVSEFATHMIDHYTKMIFEKTCEICKKSFPDRMHLTVHKRTVHKMIRAKCKDRKQVNIQKPVLSNKNKEDVGGPLFNDILNDSFDNSNLAMPNLELNQFSLSLENTVANQSILENDNLSLNADILLADNVNEFDHFNFEIGESKEQHVCDICLKSFTKVILLRLHMKMHTGTYTCHQCCKIFSRSESLNTHLCNVYKPPDFICNFCQRTFISKKQLKRHIDVVHEKKYICKKCGTNFYSPKEFNDHVCNAIPDSQKMSFNCPTCNKFFFRQATLKRHLKVHSTNAKKVQTSENFICEICGVRYGTAKGLRMHICLHKNRNYECEICNKKYFRIDVLRTHMKTHFPSKVSCKICNKECKSQSALTNHMSIHKNLFQCDDCPKSYHQQHNLLKHQQSSHSSKCNVCKKVFDSKKLLQVHEMEHSIHYIQCPVCKKFFKLKSSLRRHYKQSHPDQSMERLVSEAKYKEVVLNKTESVENFFKDNSVGELEKEIQGDYETNLVDSNGPVNLDNIVTNFDDIINDYDCTDEEYLLIDKKTSENVEGILDFNDLSMDFDSHLNIPNTAENNREICLSMPDLSTGDQEITLGENAYVLENGTIVDRKEPGKYVCYVLH